MEKTVKFEMTESQAKNFGALLDKLNSVMTSNIEKDSAREKKMSKLDTETHLLLAQAREELEKIKKINLERQKMIWET